MPVRPSQTNVKQDKIDHECTARRFTVRTQRKKRHHLLQSLAVSNESHFYIVRFLYTELKIFFFLKELQIINNKFDYLKLFSCFFVFRLRPCFFMITIHDTSAVFFSIIRDVTEKCDKYHH